MRNKKFAGLIAWIMLAMLAVSACSAPAGATAADTAAVADPGTTAGEETTQAPQTPAETAAAPEETQETETSAGEKDETGGNGEIGGNGESPEAVLERIRNTIAANAEANQPQVRTLPSGVSVQRTPATDDLSTAITTYMNYNMEYLNADHRGCNACHVDLGELVDNLEEYPHLELSNAMGLEIRLNQCLICHDYSGGTMEAGGLGSLLHTIHSAAKNPQFAGMGGDCMSCHYASEDGQGLQLWDKVKHQVLRGITDLEAQEVSGTFTWNQDYVLDSADDLFAVNWISSESGAERFAYGKTDLKPDPENDGVYDQWEISVEGQVDEPFTMTISQMIEAFGLETRVMTMQCGDNGIGMPWIGNFEVTGIDIAKLLERAGIQAGSNCLTVSNGKGTNYYTKLNDFALYGGFLVLRVAGEPLPYQSGYPVQAWMGAAAAWRNTKEVTSLIITTEDFDSPSFPAWAFNTGFFDENGVSYYEPNIGVFDLTDGQILPGGESHTFTGYAWSYDKTIAAVELSFDRGETWVRCETPDMDVTRWVYWSFEWTPPAEGAYVVTVRSVTDTGLVTYEPVEYLVNVQ